MSSWAMSILDGDVAKAAFVDVRAKANKARELLLLAARPVLQHGTVEEVSCSDSGLIVC